MATKKGFGLLLVASIAAGSLLMFSGCSGTGSDGENYDGTSYVDEDAGGLTLTVKETEMGVSEWTGFSVQVVGQDGQPIPEVEIACDTETGLALIEPSTGYEMTDSGGHISGKVGCALPGSYLIGCRLPVGAYKRQYETIRCSGPVPDGFTGFPGAGGGSLGTGDTPSGDSQGNGTGSISVASATVTEDGATTTKIDIQRGTCANSTPEVFTDDDIAFSVTNGTSSPIKLFAYEYSIPGGELSKKIYFSQEVSVAVGQSGTASAVLFKAASPYKYYVTGTYTESDKVTEGTRKVSYTIYYKDASGNTGTLTGSIGLTFGNYDHCGS